jgi:predicted transcriptional regulator
MRTTKYYKLVGWKYVVERKMDIVLEHELVNKASNLLAILSKKDALTIFLLAKDGLKAETNTPEKVGLTRKQYYTRLKQLVDTGLIDKSGDAYVHTTLGVLIHQNHLIGLLDHVRNVKQMKMIDALKRAGQFSENDISNFVGKISGKSLASSVVPHVQILTSYEDMVSVFIERIQFAKKEVFLATRFLNELIVNNILLKVKAGLNVKVVADSKLLKEYMSQSATKLQMLDKNFIERANVAMNPYYPTSEINRRVTDVPFSFVIFDQKEVGIELVNSHNPDQFSGALLIKDETVALELIKHYESLWKASESFADVINKHVGSESKIA